ncbi:MAG TPA: aminotransferase class IV [Thermodesulfobacteriota bacterium]
MPPAPPERVAYHNGEIKPESQVVVSFRDRGFKYGDAVFDATRTFGGRPFRLEAHVERLYRSLRYVRIDPGIPPDEMIRISKTVLERNLPLLAPGEDYWVSQRISRGVDAVGGELWQSAGGPTVIVECTPLPLRARARLFRDGIDVITPSVRRVPPECLSPNAKTHNYLNLVLGDLEARAHDANAWAVLLDGAGNLTEGIGSNVFIVERGRLFTPRAANVLAGVSRQTVLDLAARLGIPAAEEDISLYRAVNADEAFITSTSLCLCGVRTINHVTIGDGRVPGPITRRLTDAYREEVDYDFVDQYLKHLES